MHCSRKRLLRSGLEFHVCTINKSAHTKKVWKVITCTSYIYIYIYIYIYKYPGDPERLKLGRYRLTQWVLILIFSLLCIKHFLRFLRPMSEFFRLDMTRCFDFFQTIRMFLTFSFFMDIFPKYQFLYLFIQKLNHLFFSPCQS